MFHFEYLNLPVHKIKNELTILTSIFDSVNQGSENFDVEERINRVYIQKKTQVALFRQHKNFKLNPVLNKLRNNSLIFTEVFIAK